MSRGKDYISAGVGGAAGGWALLYTGPIGAGAVGGAVSSATRQTLEYYDEGKKPSAGRLAFDTTVGAATGKIPGIKVPGITAGKGNYNAVYKQMVTKFSKGQISNVNAKTAGKMFTGRAVGTSLVPGNAAATFAGIKADSQNGPLPTASVTAPDSNRNAVVGCHASQ